MTLGEALSILAVPSSMVQALLHFSTVEAAKIFWASSLPELRKLWRSKAFDTHPDRGGSQEAFQRVSEAWEVVSHERFPLVAWHAVRQRQPRPPVIVVEVWNTSDAGTTATGFGFGDGPPIFIRRM